MPMTITLDFDGRAIALTPAETQTVFHEFDAIRRRLEDGLDAGEQIAELQGIVQDFIHQHVHRIDRDEIEVQIDQTVWKITARRAPITRL